MYVRRQWYLRGLTAGADVSWGALDTCMQATNAAISELEGAQSVRIDAPVEQRRVLCKKSGFDLMLACGVGDWTDQ